MSCNCTLNKYQLISNEGLNHYTLTELMRLVNGLILDPSFSYAVSNLDELNEIFKFYPTKEETIRILQGETGITPQRQNLNDYNLDYAWLNYYTKEEVITFIVKGYVPEKPPQTYTFTINPVPASATVVINGIESDTVVVYKGEQVLWTVSENGYTTKMGVQDVEEDTTIEVSLEEYEEDDPSEDKPVYTVCVQTEPSDAYVFINGERENCFSGAEGTVFDYTVQAGGYVPQSGKITIDGDKTVAVVLEKEPEPETPRYTLIINPVPASATVIIDGQVRNNITVESGTVVNYSVQAEGYFFQEGSYMVTENYVLDVELEALPNYVPNYYFSINPTPSDATVVINGNEQSTYEAQEGSIIVWSVSKEGYVSQNGTYVMGAEDYVMDVELVEYVVPTFTFTINPTPSDATVIIDGVEQSSITVEGGTIVTYSVDKEGYIARSESIVVDRDMVLNVSLRQIGIYTFTVNPYPNYAIVMIDDEIRNTIAVEEGTVVTWVVSLAGYTSQAGTYKVDKDSSINVFIECLGEPQIITTEDEYDYAGRETGVIDFCTYDLSQYTGDIVDIQKPLVLFEGDLTSNGRTSLGKAFYQYYNLEYVLSVGEDMSNVKSVQQMFYGCQNLISIPYNFDVSNAEIVWGLFASCDSLKSVPQLRFNKKVTNFGDVFYGSGLETLDIVFDYNTASVNDMFSYCRDLKEIRFAGAIFTDGKTACGIEFADDVKIYYPCKYKRLYKKLLGENFENVYNTIPYGECEPTGITRIDNVETLYEAGADTGVIDLDCEWYKTGAWSQGTINPNVTTVTADWSEWTDWVSGSNTIRHSVFKNATNLQSVKYLGSELLPIQSLFEGCINLRDISCFNYITKKELYNYAFKDCSNLQDFSPINGAVIKGVGVFTNCNGLNDLNMIKDCVFSECGYMFDGCRSITDLSPISISGLGDYTGMFRNCTGITNIDGLFPNSMNSYNYIMPVYDNMFEGCSNISSISVLNDIEILNGNIPNIFTYATNMFYNCDGLKSVNLVGDFIDYNIDLRGGFAECSNLESATIKKYHYSDWNIEGLFVNCANLKKAEIKAYMQSGNRVCSVNIGNIFRGCSSLNEIYFYASSLGSYSLDCFYGLPPVGTFHYGGRGFTDEFLSLLPDGWTVVKDYE